MSLSFAAFLFYLIPLVSFADLSAFEQKDYLQYHKQISEAEDLICDDKFEEAFHIYEQVFTSYEFVFSRDLKVAAQLSFYLNKKQKALQYIKESIAAGWELKALEKNTFLKPLQDDPGWKSIEKKYDGLHGQYLSKIDQNTRVEVHQMFIKDQQKAIGALFRIGDKAQQKYGLMTFVPHSEIQMSLRITWRRNNLLQSLHYSAAIISQTTLAL